MTKIFVNDENLIRKIEKCPTWLRTITNDSESSRCPLTVFHNTT